MFITFEGIDGVGKSTQLDMLERYLVDLGKQVLRTLEPGGTELGQEIRHLLLHRKGDVSARSEALLYAADRAHHVATKINLLLKLAWWCCLTATLTPLSPIRVLLGS